MEPIDDKAAMLWWSYWIFSALQCEPRYYTLGHGCHFYSLRDFTGSGSRGLGPCYNFRMSLCCHDIMLKVLWICSYFTKLDILQVNDCSYDFSDCRDIGSQQNVQKYTASPKRKIEITKNPWVLYQIYVKLQIIIYIYIYIYNLYNMK